MIPGTTVVPLYVRDAFTAPMDYYLGYSIEIGEFGVAHVWFQCYEKEYFEKCPKHHFRH